MAATLLRSQGSGRRACSRRERYVMYRKADRSTHTIERSSHTMASMNSVNALSQQLMGISLVIVARVAEALPQQVTTTMKSFHEGFLNRNRADNPESYKRFTYRSNTRHVARRLRSLPSGSWLLRPPVTAASAEAGAAGLSRHGAGGASGAAPGRGRGGP